MKLKTLLLLIFCCVIATSYGQSKAKRDSLAQAKTIAASIKKAKTDSLAKARATTASVKKAKTDSLNKAVAMQKKAKADSLKATTVHKKAKADSIAKNTKKVTPKLFAGLSQFRTWSIGVNAGVLSPSILTGGENDFRKVKPELGYGLSVRKQFGHTFGVQFDAQQGHIAGSVPRDYENPISSFNTELGYSSSLSGILNIGSVSYLKRRHNVNFYVMGGEGLIGFAPTVYYYDGTSESIKYHAGVFKNKVYVHEFTSFGGVGIKFRLSDRFELNGGYTENFVDDDFLDGHHNYDANGRDYQKDKYSYAYTSIEMSLGRSSHPNIDWVNPVSLMYNELQNQTIQDEFELLKMRLTSIENTVIQLKRDSDEDGVPDYFDKCPNTPKGVVVDGAGCPIKAQAVDSAAIAKLATDVKDANGNINVINNLLANNKTVLFNYNSSVVLPVYFRILDAIATDLKANPTKTAVINGYASSEGTSDHNMQLSVDRAKAVKAYLINAGVNESQLTTKSYGETNAVANNASEEGRMQNRRAQIY